MKTQTVPKFTNPFLCYSTIFLVGLICLVGKLGWSQEVADQADVSTSIGSDGTGRIVIEAHGELPKPPVFYTANTQAAVQVGSERIEQIIQLTIEVIQGDAKTLSLGLAGRGEVTEVQSENLQSWSVRQEGSSRFLDLHLKEDVTELESVVKIRSPRLQLPVATNLTHLSPGKSVAFNSTIAINYSHGVEGTVTVADGFAPLDAGTRVSRFQTTTGGQIKLSLARDGAAPAPVELTDTTLNGVLHPNGKSIAFQLRSAVHVTEDNAEITILSGNAAVSQVPANAAYRLRLSTIDGRSVYKIVFAKPGTFSVSLDFVAALATVESNRQSLDFTVAASAVVPLILNGLDADLEFHRDQQSVVPLRDNDHWLGFLPATGRARLEWKAARKTGEGKLFFTTTGQIEAKVGAGLLRQDHQIDYQVLQGELKFFSILLHGPGEVLDVQGNNIVAWNVTGEGEQRQLDVTLSQPVTAASQIRVRSQTPLGAFPVRVDGLRMNPVGAIRHSGYLRITNRGSVRLEPTGLVGLTQLSPEQFPSEPMQARQIFVYRFPAADHEFAIAADRIQPEVNISQLVLYQLAETDRVIKAEIELEIREAPIREWDFGIPSAYSVVSISGASVVDYITASEVVNASRNLKVIFSQDVKGRQLVNLHLEKNEAAADGNWTLPRIEYPGAKTVRGNIGIIGAPGFRIAVEETDLLVEKPLSYFPKPVR